MNGLQGQFLEEIKRRVELKAVGGVTVSTKQDDFVVLHVPAEYDTVMEMVFKTEFLTLLAEKYKAVTGGTLKVRCCGRGCKVVFREKLLLTIFSLSGRFRSTTCSRSP
jgi:hypothetical protein